MLDQLLGLPGAKTVLRALRRELRWTPMSRVLGELRNRGIRVGQLQALEIFGASGESHVIDYASKVARLSIWEINPQYHDA